MLGMYLRLNNGEIHVAKTIVVGICIEPLYLLNLIIGIRDDFPTANKKIL